MAARSLGAASSHVSDSNYYGGLRKSMEDEDEPTEQVEALETAHKERNADMPMASKPSKVVATATGTNAMTHAPLLTLTPWWTMSTMLHTALHLRWEIHPPIPVPVQRSRLTSHAHQVLH
jgi:hypothetical protein